ncbi:MAG: phosphoribosyltransferase family protein [Patescibacteria group bacterium]
MSNNCELHLSCSNEHNLKIHAKAFSCYIYTAAVRKIIRNAKFVPKIHKNLSILTRHVCQQNLVKHFLSQYDVILPIPISVNRYCERGFNQAEIIGSEISKNLNISMNTKVLARAKDTPPQHKLSRTERYNNLKSCYKVNTRLISKYKSQKVLLVDDVCTSGATFYYALKILQEYGIVNIGCFSLAKRL